MGIRQQTAEVCTTVKNDDSFVVKLVTVMIYATLAFLILSFVMVQVVPLLINPSNYKSDIIEMVMEKTGRTLTLEGDIKLDLFPETSITRTVNYHVNS